MKLNETYLLFTLDHCPDAAARRYRERFGVWPEIRLVGQHWVMEVKDE